MRKNLLLGICLAVSSLSVQGQTTLTLQPGPTDGKDAELYSCVPCGYSTRNFGDKRDLNSAAWTNNLNTSNIRSLVQFDLSSIPANAVITDARLSLYYNSDNQEGHHVSSFFAKNTTMVTRVTSNWDEHTVTWNNQPSVTTLHQVTLAASTSSSQSYPNINVTALVQDMVANPAQSFGFRLKMKTEDEPRKLLFASSDNPNAALRPKLVVTYTVPHPRLSAPSITASEIAINSLNCFPNPVHDKLNISVQALGEQTGILKIFNIEGKNVYQQTLVLTAGQNDFPVALDNWEKGVYFITITSGDNILTRKIIVQ